MKNIFLFVSALVLFMTTSCQKEKASEGLTRITYYAEITLEGSSVVVVPVGGTYEEPGFSGNENGVDKTSEIVVSDNIETDTPGVYTVTYSLFNEEGYATIETRSVVVAVIDADAPASGSYFTNIVRTESDGSNPRPRGPFTITFVNEGNDVFAVSCLLGQFYSAGYGPNYAMVGKLLFDKSTNTFSLIESHVAGWDDSLEDYLNSTYDPATGEMYWESIFAGSDIFAVTLTK